MWESFFDSLGKFCLILLAVFTCGYMLPTSIALWREHRNTGGVFILNLFLGWTLVGWVIALIWAVHHERPRVTI